MELALRDESVILGQNGSHTHRGVTTFMPAAKSDARWADAVPLTIGLWLFMLLVFMPGIIARHPGDWVGVAIDSSTVCLSIGLGLLLFILFRGTADWQGGPRLVLMVAATIGMALASTIFDLKFTDWGARNLGGNWLAIPVDFKRASQSLLNYLCVFSVNVALFQFSFSRRRSLTRERQLAAAETAARQAELEALRLQLNPHFLFNTLNAISSLIVTRRNEDAEEMTDKLSSFLRASLACNPTELVPLEEELDLMADYLSIEAVRFGERLRVEISCTPEARAVHVPGLLIQPLVENAVKYGVARSAQPVTIAIDAVVDEGDLCIVITNDGGAGLPSVKSTATGVGLRNVRRRLAALYGERASLVAEPVGAGFLARICLPIDKDVVAALLHRQQGLPLPR
ncbi:MULTISPECIES: sensor histidine kinase [Sphingomonadales]|uniref:Histidine kinase n=2 Tax=Edaphosphingomonas TaxID=3423724 RepID=A0A2T4HZI2_9SPHN|nr:MULTISPECIES: histidine kinase [Sphingomonas]AGH51090.1 signal transduction histidine kinase LytS [Sphingomonas sp. MM-1]MDX3885850.1 histidine kinase [Sphingomonas sp.]OHT19645.1 Sensor histidine kinase YehU [Sphingomonas haloaromaticamans]PTD21634.1 histidine kinase [Sphingomonas fennica]